MALPLIAALAPAIAGLFGTLFNAGKQQQINREQQDFSLDMYKRQRTDALADYAMQNEYNHPSSVMARLRQAKINPRLAITGGNAITTASPIRNADAPKWSPHAPQIDTSFVGQSINTYYDTQMKEAQTDNLRTQNTVIANEAVLKAAQVEETMARTGRSRFDLELAKDLRQNSMDMATANLRKVQTDTRYTEHQDARSAAMNSATLKQMVEQTALIKAQRERIPVDIEKVRAEIKLLGIDQDIKSAEKTMRDNNTSFTDAAPIRLATIIGTKVVNKLKSSLNKVKNHLSRYNDHRIMNDRLKRH